MPLINDKSVLEALHDVGVLQCRPASLKDILEYMCFAHPDVSTNLLTTLQLTLDAGVHYGYVDQIDENWYVSSRREEGNLYRLEPSNTREKICTSSEENEVMDSEILYCQSKENCTVNSENNFNAEDAKPKSNSNTTCPSPSTLAPSSSSSPKSRSQENEFKSRKQLGRRKSSNERKPKRRIVANRNRKRKPQRRRP